MNKIRTAGLFSVLFALMSVAPALAAAPTSNITAGGWFICAVGTESALGHECHFGVQAKCKDGVWTGTGSFMDKDYRLKAIIRIDDVNWDLNNYKEVVGWAKVYVDNKLFVECPCQLVLTTNPKNFRIWLFSGLFGEWGGYEASGALNGEGMVGLGNIVIH